MTAYSKSGNTVLRLWLLLHRVRDVLVRCEDSIFSEYGITYEQFTVLGQTIARGGSLRIIDIARALESAPNSVSTLVDRMVKAGLIRRTRGKMDRRVVHVSLTDKGEQAIKLAVPAGWEFIQKILSPISYKDKEALASLLEALKSDLLGYLNPEADMTEIIRSSPTNQPGLYESMVKSVPAAGSEAKDRSGKKRKTIR